MLSMLLPRLAIVVPHSCSFSKICSVHAVINLYSEFLNKFVAPQPVKMSNEADLSFTT